jgi:glutamate synthase (NADPH/NADH) small chain
MEAEGTEFRTSVNVGADVTVEELQAEFDAIVLAGGATLARDLPVPGRELGGIHQAMEFLPWSNRAQQGDLAVEDVPITAKDKDVIIIGGGDTGADCLGTSHRHGARSVTQLEIMARPVDGRPEANPWPTYPMSYKVTSAHEEGGDRVYAVNTECFLGDDDGNVSGLRLHQVEMVEGRFQKIEGTDEEIPAQLVLLAMGFLGPQAEGMVEQLGVDLDPRSNVARDDCFASSVDGVFVAGDMGRGQSLIVWAIAEGRSCASEVDRYLMGETALPRIIDPTTRPLV